MRPEQQAVLTKYHKPPDTTSNEKEHEKCDLLSLEKLPLDFSSHPEEHRSILGWSRAAVSRTTVSKNTSATHAVAFASACEKSVATPIVASMQHELDRSSRQTKNRNAGRVNGSTHGVDEQGPAKEAKHSLRLGAKPQKSPIPGISIDKPLPPSPARSLSADSSRSPYAPDSDGHADNKDSSHERTIPVLLMTAPSVRRIKSYGDLLSSSPKQPRPPAVERRASHIDLRSQNESDPTIRSQERAIDHQTSDEKQHIDHRTPSTASFLSPTATHTPPSDGSSRGGFLKKRASSLGLGRRASSKSMETIRAPDQDASHPETAVQARNVSSATAPPSTRPHDTDAVRKRKPSMFGGLFSGLWRARPKDTIVNPSDNSSSADLLLRPADVPPTHSMQSLHDTVPESQASSSASSDASFVDHGPKSALPVPRPDSDDNVAVRTGSFSDRQAFPTNQPRRYSIMHSFFRSVPSSKPASGSESTSSLRSTSPASHSIDLNIEPDTLARQPIDIPHSTLPQLPSISRDLGEISFGSLFDGGERRSRGRSRASTRGSLSSLFNTPSQARSMSPHRDSVISGSPKIGSPRSRSNSQLQQSITASDLASGPGGPLHSPKTAEDNVLDTLTNAEKDSDCANSAREPPKSPTVNGIIAENRRRTRLFRSNSASSVSTTSWSSPPEPSKLESKISRPTFIRARSSSTISSTSKATRALSPLFESAAPADSTSSQQRSPAILVTSDQQLSPYFENVHYPACRTGVITPTGTSFESLNRASRSSSVSTGVASPTLLGDSFSTTPQVPASADSNLADAMSDFILAPSTALGTRMSADSQSSSFSHASSLLSSSPVTSNGVGQNSRASSIISKTLRRRANTMGPILATSASPNTADPPEMNLRGPGSFDSAEILTRPGRSGSSSRLSSFFASPASSFSTSPTESSGLWLAPRDTTKTSNAGTRNIHLPRSIARRLSSSLLTSTKATLEDHCSIASSPLLSASTTPDSAGLGHGQSDIDAPHSVASHTGTSSSPNRSRSNSAVASDLRVHAMPDDTPSVFLSRVKSLAGPQDIARILSEKSDALHSASLRLYLEEFDFVNDAIDIAIRKLLLGLHLPQETQQIDRVMQAFAERYNSCNPALFTSPDQPYILAFSIIMLHTDAFNKSNKKKMTRADYVKNTKIDGISTILLEYIYDNITYAPFIYADDSADPLGNKRSGDTHTSSNTVGNPGVKERNKLEVYRNIAGDQLSRFRVDMGLLVPIKNPFSYTGTVAFFDCSMLHNAFIFAHTITVPHIGRDVHQLPLATSGPENILRVVRVGVLERKDDISSAGKKATSRKWKSWGVLLLEGQLVFFRDPSIALDLQARIREIAGEALPQSADQSIYLSWQSDFKPDEIVSLDNVVVLYDFTYTRYTHVFRCLQPDGRQVLLRASSDTDLNLWMSTVNYAATFRTVGIRLLAASEGAYDSDIRDRLPQPSAWTVSKPKLSPATTVSAESIPASDTTSVPQETEETPPADVLENQMRDLLFPRTVTSDLQPPRKTLAPSNWHATRGDIERSKIMDLESSIREEQTELASDIRLVRNIAIMTPFNGATRQRLQQAAQTVARRIRKTRQNIARTICYRECLCRDLLATEREAHRQRFHQSTSSSHSNLRLRQSQHAWQETGVIGQSFAAASAEPDELDESTQMSKSASQDEISSLVRSTSLLKRSFTADMQSQDGFASFDLHLQEPDRAEGLQYNKGRPDAGASGSTGMPTAFSAKYGASPTLGSGTFETVREDGEPSSAEAAHIS